jgi:hypothetical protein
LRNFRLAEEHWNAVLDCGGRDGEVDWGIFGSLKSTETHALVERLADPALLRNFRLAEEHWNEDVESGIGVLIKLRNFRLAEEHWNSMPTPMRAKSAPIEEFSARWRALKRSFQRAASTRSPHWGIFGSLKSTETLRMPAVRSRARSIEEFSARWRALKQLLAEIIHIADAELRNFRLAEEHWNNCACALRRRAARNIEEFSARWRALKRHNRVVADVRRPDWGIFGSLKSTETQRRCAAGGLGGRLRNFRLAEEHWNTECAAASSPQAQLRNFRLAEEHWNSYSDAGSAAGLSLRNFRLAEEHWNVRPTRRVVSAASIEEFSARWRALKPGRRQW